MQISDRQMARTLKFVAGGEARLTASAKADTCLATSDARGTISVPDAVLAQATRQGLAARSGARLAITPVGKAWLARRADPKDGMQAQHQERVSRAVEIDGERKTATVNLAESPLAHLASRKDKTGRAFLSAGEMAAGERLRADYEFGRIAPRLGANWEAAISMGKRGGGNAKADLSDDALAARQRVTCAIEAVGPELNGILIDVCCFLKGLEQVESERGWPRRSAKLMLKTALGVLDRHYSPKREWRSRPVLHWGSDDYRPRAG